MVHEIRIKKAVLKNLRKLPDNVQERFDKLAKVLHQSGPTGAHIFLNYSKLGEHEYHCHLTHHYVACWRCEKGTITIEVYYAGSRENAPY
jgi:mRNA-degrading endonuclease RelE of RelBE toxin-antitoxin system